MAEIHRTTMTPTKLELLSGWLPKQPWYAGNGGTPELRNAGGFRLDDPSGAVGIEFMVATDESGGQVISYHVPLSYRGAPLAGRDDAFIGTSEHGVLGRRWVYDGVHDPVLVAQLAALLARRAEPQAQSVSDTPDPTVTVHSVAVEQPAPISPDIETVSGGGIRVVRVLRPDGSGPGGTCLTAGWTLPDGSAARGCVAYQVR